MAASYRVVVKSSVGRRASAFEPQQRSSSATPIQPMRSSKIRNSKIRNSWGDGNPSDLERVSLNALRCLQGESLKDIDGGRNVRVIERNGTVVPNSRFRLPAW
jgi:hypothetical protein